MSKHTPGPWAMQIVRPGDKSIEVDGHMAYGYGFIAQVPRDDCDHNEALANARLIAAAPDLLEALKEMRAVAWGGEEARADAILKAEAAIAKAEGR